MVELKNENNYKIISLDIETSNLNMRAEGLYFSKPNGWRTSCACIYDGYKQIGYYFVKEPEVIKQAFDDFMKEHPVKDGMFKHLYDFNELESFLEDYFNKGYTLLTHNGNSFDLPILSKPVSKGGANLKNIIQKFKEDDRNLDTCEYLKKETGYRFRLQYLIKGIIDENSSKLMDASNAPVEWSKGNYLQVLCYCMCDSIFTYEVYKTVKNNKGCFSSRVKHNKKEFIVDVENINW